MGRNDLDSRAEDLATRIGDGLGTHGRSLEDSASRAGRALPKSVRRDIEVITRARATKGNPKLERQTDMRAVDRAYRRAADWLATLDRPARRRAAALDLLADLAFKLLVVAGLVLTLLIWRGLL